MTDFKKIYTGDYSKEGYDDGITDSQSNKPKSHFGTLNRNPVNFFWQADNASDSYSTGYDKGYVDGQRVSHDIYSSHSGAKMGSLQQQYQVLEQAKAAIAHHKSILDQARDLYGNQVNAMQGAGFASEYTTELVARNDRLSRKTDDVLDELTRQLTMIEDFQASIERMIRDAQSD
ncbi:MAG: hypothetical protein CSB47_00190 [Proteobacteria bacterium]|nr:MAG: hypothetical protein CSB47_00190 [Pseudomonadota bacterium]